MGSVPMSDLVTIIVKAPNQQIADQIIQCHHSWTIKKLKDYLTEVYPSKPKLEEQKLIYSGKLLTDSAVLKDVLRTYEGQENHTVHLVCTTKAQKFAKSPSSFSNTPANVDRPQSSTTDVNRHQETSQARNTPTVNTTPGSVPVTGLRAPTFDQMTANQFNLNNFDPRYFWPSATTFPNLNEADPMSQQYAYMQQAYAQYLSQYMQMMGQPGLSYMPSHVPQFVGPSQNMPLPNDRANGERNIARENQPGQPVVGAVGNDDDEENRNNRDWLDWFYVFSRIVVLFSVVYFYSTPLRLLAVSLLLCMFYLHQNMRVQNNPLNVRGNNNNNNNNNAVNQNNNQNNENRAPPENHRADENAAGAQPRPAPNADNAANTPAGAAESANARPEATAVPAAERPSTVALTLLAIRTFFLSLVPDHHVL